MESSKSFTGRRRKHRTPWTVKAADTAAGTLIRVGGIGTIVAVCFVAVYLVYEVFPLFGSASVRHDTTMSTDDTQVVPLHVAIDEYRSIGWAIFADSKLRSFRLDTGETLHEQSVADSEASIAAVSVNVGSDQVVLGLSDGTLRVGTIGFDSEFVELADLPTGTRDLQIGDLTTIETGVGELTPQRQLRVMRVAAKFGEPVEVSDAPVTLLAHAPSSKGPTIAVFSADDQLRLISLQEKKNLLTGETTLRAKKATLPFKPREGPPGYLRIAGDRSKVYLAWPDGWLQRYDTRSLKDTSLVQELFVTDENAELTALGMLLGGSTLVAGDDRGGLTAWFPVQREDAMASDGFELAQAHRLPASGAAVTSLASSGRTRMIVAGYADGAVRLFHVTTRSKLLDTDVGQQEPVTGVAVAPKDDGLVAMAGSRLWQCEMDPKHPEATLAALFLPVWYEGYPEPIHMWQSSSATQESEPKLGMFPLVFGTLKATFYSMLFGAPLALLAAVYTSEFLHPTTRSRVKPTIELMASLPSVVLGFLAALVFAPVVERLLPGVLAALFIVPAAFLLGAFLWQLIPHRTALLAAWVRLPLFLASLSAALLASFAVGPFIERWLFAGDILRWLDGQVGTGAGGWLLLMLPLSAAGVTTAVLAVINPTLRRVSGEWGRATFALVNLAKFIAAAALTALLAYGLSCGLSAAGFDPRGGIVDTYIPRNALVVGFVMGFAIIPIIYTIAEDALSTVPAHLRSASLGAGATVWQTAVRVVVPTAMSGLFSALMIGLGRAVGETMIVLMAAGNTPILEINIFNGFRTLAANIAVELPEAAQQSTHYRTLFLAALTLFLLTFVVNTVAEIVRLRFRRKAVSL